MMYFWTNGPEAKRFIFFWKDSVLTADSAIFRMRPLHRIARNHGHSSVPEGKNRDMGMEEKIC